MYITLNIVYVICLLRASGRCRRIDKSGRVSENVCVDDIIVQVVVFVVYYIIYYISTNPLLATIRDTIMIKGHRRACDNDTPPVCMCVSRMR